ncbi:MAG: MarR family transcriptional regulator [Caldimonas sp.]|uniref:MarR family winged helix-turn-helix transcriptional regulator n=1 Tax=Caldimonas taiwanensis TaxID=307483 RepID=UPI0007811EC3|nr:MarR family transcriptional regulator [Caldimonas taiwanensis]GIX23857.1 MAG: MarR family transcriptional regulator [Caldimonas sp.]
MRDTFPHVKTVEVAQACLCLHAQRAARVLARHFDEVFRPLDLTNGQFSLLMALNRPHAPTVGELAPFLAMDRTTLTALIKPLERRGLLAVIADDEDRRKRRVRLTASGHALLKRAYPLWCDAHATLERRFADAPVLRDLLSQVTSLPQTLRADRKTLEDRP